MKGKPIEYVYFVKNYIHLENILAVFMKLYSLSSTAHHS